MVDITTNRRPVLENQVQERANLRELVLYRSIVQKRKVYKKAKFSVFRSIFVPILTYGHKCWVMTKKVRSRVQAAEIGFFQKVKNLSLFNKIKTNVIRQSFNIEQLHLRIERSQLRWYGYVTRITHEPTEKQQMNALPRHPSIDRTTVVRSAVDRIIVDRTTNDQMMVNGNDIQLKGE